MELLDQLEAENPEDAALAPKVGFAAGRMAPHSAAIVQHGATGRPRVHVRTRRCMEPGSEQLGPCRQAARAHGTRRAAGGSCCRAPCERPMPDPDPPPRAARRCPRPQDLSEWAVIYIRYLQIFRRLEAAYDQVVHPQKRQDIRRALEACMGRALEVRHWMVSLLPS